MDVDQDGVISAADLKATMKSVGAQSLHDEEVRVHHPNRIQKRRDS